VTIGLLLAATRLTSTTLDRTTDWDRTIAGLQLDVGLSHVWLEEAIAGDRTVVVAKDVFGTIDGAAARCRALAGAPGTDDGGIRPVVARLCARLGALRTRAEQRWADRTTGTAGSPVDQAYDAAVTATLHAADEAAHAVRLRMAHTRTVINWITVGLVVGVLALFGGMTFVVGRRAKQLAAHNERLRRIDRLRDDFIASVSHELRTPLTSTLGFLQTLERPDLKLEDDQRRELVEIARLQAEHLAELVEDLLVFAAAETGRLHLRREDVDLGAILEECRRATEPLAAERGIAVRFDAERAPRVRGDRAKLAKLLANLVSNALKFTPAGGSVEVRALAVDGHARLEVSDTGIGIPAADLPYLFERFFRGAGMVEQAVPGAGLGLPVARAIADAHDGGLTVTSEEGRGTTVLVRLPLP
jgi:signal transduction histidine kinase